MSKTKVTPEVLWAQRSSDSEPEKNVVYLTISVPDVPKSSVQLELKPTGVYFTGTSDSKKLTYHVDLELFGEIDVEESKTNHTPKNIEFVLRKKELKEEFWPRLLKDSKKVHYLKTDFDKWVDEDEQETAPDDDYMGNFGGAGAGGMPGMPGMGGMGADGGLGGIDFSKLAGGGDGLGDMDDGEELGDDDSDEEVPGLAEDADAPAAGAKADDAPVAGKGKAKIEEIP